MRTPCAVACSAAALFLASALPSQGIQGRWAQIGPDTGAPTVMALAFDPENAAIVYAGLDGGGVARSGDGGRTWSLRSPDLNTDASVHLLAISPSLPRLIYAATSTGLYKSPTRGRTWVPVSLPVEDISAIALHPSNPNVVYVGGSNGLFESADGGASWSRLPTGPSGSYQVFSLAIDPVHPSRVYAGITDAVHGSGLYRSRDDGRTWARVIPGLPVQIVVSPAAAATAYAVEARFILRSTDSGDHWQIFYRGSGVLAADPQDARTLYLGPASNLVSPAGLLKTNDEGRHWTRLAHGLPDSFSTFALAIAPSDPSRLRLGVALTGIGQGGLAELLASDDGGASWTSGQRGLVDQRVRALAVGRDGSFFATTGTGLAVSHDGGTSWVSALSAEQVGGANDLQVNAISSDPNDSATVYAVVNTPRGGIARQLVWKTIDGGATWTGLGNGLPANDAEDLIVDPRDSRTLYLATQISPGGDIVRGVWKSTDAGASWAQLSLPGPPNGLDVQELALDPAVPDTLYAAAFCVGIFKTTDAGATWTKALSSPGQECLSWVAVAPSAPQVVYAAGAATIFRSTDGGATWTSFPGVGKPFQFELRSHHPMAVDPRDSATLYATGTGGVSRSVAGGPWVRLDEGLVCDEALTLEFDPSSPTRLFVGTANAGVFVRTSSTSPGLDLISY